MKVAGIGTVVSLSLIQLNSVSATEIVGTKDPDTIRGTVMSDTIFVGPKAGELEVLSGNQVFAAGNGETVPAYSRDGSVLYYSLGTWGYVETYKFDTATGERTIAGVGAEPMSSADGKSFATQTTLEGINLYDPQGGHRYIAGPYGHVSWVSNDGMRVAFSAGIEPYFWDAESNVLRRIDTNGSNIIANGGSWWAILNEDARYAVFSSAATNLVSNDTNGVRDIFLKDLSTERITRISMAADGTQSNGHSGGYGNGGYEGSNRGIDVSEDFKIIAYQSQASNLVESDGNGSISDIFLQNMTTGVRRLVSVSYDGRPANGPSTNPAVSGNGRFVVFNSEATNLVPGDTNGVADTFVVDTLWNTIARVNVASDGTQANAGGVWWNHNHITSDGKQIVFVTNATNIFTDPTASAGNRNVGIATIKFDQSDNYVFGGPGDDLIFGQDGPDTLNGDGGSDDIYGEGDDDTIAGGSGNDTEVGGAGNDTVVGGPGDDFIYGDDNLTPLDTNNSAYYLSTSLAESSIGTNSLPSKGLDTIDYSKAKAAITVNLKTGTAKSTLGPDKARIGNDKLFGIENIKSGPYNDKLRGSSANNFIDGGRGKDTVIMSGKMQQYTIKYNRKTNIYTIIDKKSGRDGTDRLRNVEIIRFTDRDKVTVSVSAPAKED